MSKVQILDKIIKRNMPLLTNLRNRKYALAMIVTALVLFAVSYKLIADLPGTNGYACVHGANLTPTNIGFAIVMSTMAGVMMAGIWALIDRKSTERKLAVGSLTGSSLIIGTFTMFCTLCTLPVISLFGLSIGLQFFTDYDLLFKTISLVLLSTSLYLLNKQLSNNCALCAEQSSD